MDRRLGQTVCSLTAPRPAVKLPAPGCRIEHVTRQKAAHPDFEAALAELESIVQRLEQGELSLEDSLRQFERGVVLTRSCQKSLRQAEEKIRVFARKGDGEVVEQEFDPPDPD